MHGGLGDGNAGNGQVGGDNHAVLLTERVAVAIEEGRYVRTVL